MAPNERPTELEEPSVDQLKDEFTPRQEQNWDQYMGPVFERLETAVGRKWFLRTFRPKKRGDGKMKRDHVEMGSGEHQIHKEMEDFKNPRRSFQGLVMAKMMAPSEKEEELENAVEDIQRATLEHMKETRPARAKRLAKETARVASAYGVGD